MTLAGRGEVETRVRGSRFLGFAEPAESEEAARALLSTLQRTFFDATHHCSAWRLHDGLWRANDAGEPGGSAGAPILAAVDAAQLLDVVVVVVRYFGGTRLGVGGLVRAYGEAAAAALEAAQAREAVPASHIRIVYPYGHTAAVMRALEIAGAAEMEHGFSAADSAAEVTAIVPTAAVSSLEAQLREQTAGAVAAEALASGLRLFRSPPGR